MLAQQSFERRCETLGIRGIHLSCPHPSKEASAVAADLLATEPSCTAAITTGWQFSGLMAALRVAGRHVPDDFSIVSVISSQYAEMLTPALTNVEWPAFEAGRLAAQMLIERIGDDRAPVRQLLIGGDLVVRESTAAPPAPRALRTARAS